MLAEAVSSTMVVLIPHTVICVALSILEIAAIKPSFRGDETINCCPTTQPSLMKDPVPLEIVPTS
jgi:hypothetical protein